MGMEIEMGWFEDGMPGARCLLWRFGEDRLGESDMAG
jgi:hypothetical protein